MLPEARGFSLQVDHPERTNRLHEIRRHGFEQIHLSLDMRD